MAIVRVNSGQELSAFYPPPHDFLGVSKCPACGLRHARSRGMGDVSASQIQGIVTTGVSTTTSLLVGLSVLGGPAGAAVGALIAVGSLIASMIGHGCGQSCIIASADANKLEPLLGQNRDAYLASPVHYASMQAAALNNFDTIWNALKTACSDPSLGSAGQRCISDRQQGSCKYKTSPGGWQNGKYVYNGPNGSGDTCWNWFVGYRDVIANDPTVVADPAPVSTTSSTIGGNAPSSGGGSTISSILPAGFNLQSLILPAAVIGGGILLASLIGGGD